MSKKIASNRFAFPLSAILLLLLLIRVAFSEGEWEKIVPSPEVVLRDPRSLSVSAEKIIYISDTGHNRVIAVDTSGKLVAETGGFGTSHGQFQWPRDIVADRGNAVWVVDYGNRRIEKFSRLLEYQGTLQITEQGDNTPHQPETLAISQQGDLFVYDRDGGRIVRYDPLLRLQAELGSGSGSQFVSNISAMAFVPGLGLFWLERGNSVLGRSDLLLNPLHMPAIKLVGENIVLSNADSCLLYGSVRGLVRWCNLEEPRDTVIFPAEFTAEDIKGIQAVAAATDGDLFLLDGRRAAIYRFRSRAE